MIALDEADLSDSIEMEREWFPLDHSFALHAEEDEQTLVASGSGSLSELNESTIVENQVLVRWCGNAYVEKLLGT